MGKKIVVTGAGGYIGRYVVSALCDSGAEVTAVTRSEKEIDSRADILVKDIFQMADPYEETGRPDVCIHLAWQDGFVHNSAAHMGKLSDHYTFISRMIESGLKQLVVMGTMHEVGYFEGAICEDTPCNPISMYGIAKDALRKACFLLAKQKGVCLQWVRAYYILGDDSHNHSIFTKIGEAEKQGKEFFPLNSGKNKYDFIDVKELGEQIAATAMQTEVAGVINCCSGKPVSLGEKVEEYIAEHGYKIKPKYGIFPDRPYDSPAIWGDSEKIDTIMKNKPQD